MLEQGVRVPRQRAVCEMHWHRGYQRGEVYNFALPAAWTRRSASHYRCDGKAVC